MAITTPVINRIIRMTEFDLLRTAVKQGNMYMCLDSQKLYFDESDSKRTLYFYTGVKTVNDLLYNITPSMNTTYYCWEDNSLWLWMNKWITLWSDSTYPSAYVYDNSNNIDPVYRYDQPLLAADDNGLLKDGSVVIRDRQRIIKGKLYIDDGNDNLIISSFLGGGMRLLPNGKISTQGELYICDDTAQTDEDSIPYQNVSLITLSDSESTVTPDDDELRTIQIAFNDNNCKAPQTVEVAAEEYTLSNKPDETKTSYIVVYKNNSDESKYFTLINNIHTIPTDGKPTYSYIRSEFHTMANDMYIDYSQSPETDYNLYQKPSHKYKVYHEGNLDASALHVLTPIEIYNKLKDESIPNPMEFNVQFLQGKVPDDFANKVHTHTTSDITDFNDKSQEQATIIVKQMMNNINGEGITITFDDIKEQYKFSANEFNLSFNGGATGTGKISHLTDTSITLTVNPDRHVHQNYIDRMDSLQDQIAKLDVFDPDEYYNRTEVDNKIRDISPTTTPTPGKALAVNDDGILPAPSLSAGKLTEVRTIDFIGDITGSVTTDFSTTPIDVSLSADNIVSSIATPGKALKLDNDGNLPTNALSASALNHTIAISLTGGITASGTLDTATQSLSMNTTLNIPDDVLREDDIGILIPSLDENGKIPEAQIPEMPASLMPKGLWNATTGAPTTEPEEGYLYQVSTAGTFEGDNYKIGDWCVFMNSEWNHINTNDNVLSVNGKTGIVNLIATDVNAIGLDYIDYNLGETIPQNKVVLTSQKGIIEGASVSNLTSPFSLVSDSTGDIIFDSTSNNTQTNGLQNLDVKMTITENGYTNILENASYTIYNDGVKYDHRPKLDFTGGLTVSNTGTDTITIGTEGMNIEFAVLYYNYNDSLDDLKSKLDELYDSRAEKPILIIATLQYTQGGTQKEGIFYFVVDKSLNNRAQNTTVASTSTNNYIYDNLNTSGVNNVTNNFFILNIVFANTSDALIDSIQISSSTDTFVPPYLTTQVQSNTTAFMPTMNAQPTSKQYVDNCFNSRSYVTTIGNGTATDYTINHNLNSNNVIVQCRMTDTKEECFINNTIVDANTIKLSSTSAISTNGVTVYIWAI